MKIVWLVAAVLLVIATSATKATQGEPSRGDTAIKVVLLGTAGGPTISPERSGISTLVIAGPERLLFDAGRNLTTGMARVGVLPADVTKVFLTHLHSDHIISLPELLLFPWASQGRAVPLHVWGPVGTAAMMNHLQDAFAFDIHIRRDVDERFPADGIKVVATDIQEGVVHDANGVTVRAILVDHDPIVPAFGYRIDYRGHSVVLSGDTKPSDNLIKMAQGVDVLIHEVGRWKQDPALSGPPDERIGLGGGYQETRARVKAIAEHHTDGSEAGRLFERAKPKLALFSHYNADMAATLRLVRQNYAGAVEFGLDMMTVNVGETVTVTRYAPPAR
jgi:ribonuclease Z